MKRALPYLVLLLTFSFSNIAYAAATTTSSAIIGPNGIEVSASATAGNAEASSNSSITNNGTNTTTNSVTSTANSKTSPKKTYKKQTVAKKEKTTNNTTPTKEKTTTTTKVSQTVPAAVTQAMEKNNDSVITEKTVKRFSGFMISILVFQVINTLLLFSLLFKLYKPAQQRF